MDNNSIKSDRFKRVASKRVDKVLVTLRSLTKCANLNNYQYSQEDVEKMLKAIKNEIKVLEIEYKKNLNKNSEKFNF